MLQQHEFTAQTIDVYLGPLFQISVDIVLDVWSPFLDVDWGKDHLSKPTREGEKAV